MRSKAVCSSWSPSGSESLFEASSLAGWSRSVMVFSFRRASHHTERECLSARLLRALRLGLCGYSPECVEDEFCEVRIRTILRSCACLCNPSYLPLLYNWTGLPRVPPFAEWGQQVSQHT